jgi:type II secretory pathway component PulM
MAMYQKQFERAERLQERAEAIQGRAGKAAKFVLWIAVPLLAILFLLMFQPYLERALS